MIVAIPVTEDGGVGRRWGKAERVAVAAVDDGAVTAWEEYDVRWDLAHDQGTEGSHHARVVRFLREHGVTHVVVDHMGAGMVRMMATMGILVSAPRSADAREAARLAG